ncbi:MAG: hypothetical protein CSB48_03575 [Proteobacteria bacterium]|nr:MAG: hypothetical protein CSB48_03575 [Pseudomonadota bacterium]
MSSGSFVIPRIIETHLEEISTLYLQWCDESELAALPSSGADLSWLKKLRRRIDAHLDGLVASGDAGWNIAAPFMLSEDEGEYFAIALLAFERNVPQIKDVVEGALESTALYRAQADAFAWRKSGSREQWAARFARSTRLELRSLCLHYLWHNPDSSARAIFDADWLDLQHRTITDAYAQAGVVLPVLMEDLRKFRRVDLVPLLRKLNDTEVSERNYHPLSTRVMIGDTTALDELKCFVLEHNEYQEQATELCFSRYGFDRAKMLLAELRATGGHERCAIIAVGAMRAKPLLPWLLKQMARPESARLAGQAWARVMGVDLAEQGLVLDDDSLDEAWLDFDGDEHLPWPDSEKIRRLTG